MPEGFGYNSHSQFSDTGNTKKKKKSPLTLFAEDSFNAGGTGVTKPVVSPPKTFTSLYGKINPNDPRISTDSPGGTSRNPWGNISTDNSVIPPYEHYWDVFKDFDLDKLGNQYAINSLKNSIWQNDIFRNFMGENLPKFSNMLDTDVAIPQLPKYSAIPDNTLPDKVSFLDTLNTLFPGTNVGESQYNSPDSFLEVLNKISPNYDPNKTPDFVRTKSITPNVLNDPSFKAFQEDLGVATDRNTDRIMNLMARRGITSSDATLERFGDLNEANARAIASEAGRIASPLIQTSVLNEAINEPIRETNFNVSTGNDLFDRIFGMGSKETSFGLTDTANKVKAGTEALNRLLEMAGTETTIDTQDAVNKANLNKDNFFREQDRLKEELNLPMQQQDRVLGTMANRLNVLNTLFSGGQSDVSGALNEAGAVRTAERNKELDKRTDDTRNQQLLGGIANALISNPTIMNALGSGLETAGGWTLDAGKSLLDFIFGGGGSAATGTG